jgi:glycosyltransferase involved in cell wall biosynthesis
MQRGKIKILVLSLPLEREGGLSNYVKLLIENINKDKIEISHFETGRRNYDATNSRTYFTVLFQLIKFQKRIEEFKPDIIHLNMPVYPRALLREYLFLKIAKRNQISVIASMHGWERSFEKKIIKGGIWRKFAKRIFLSIDRFIELSASFKRNLIDLGVKDNKIYVISTFAESSKYHPVKKVFSPPFNVLFCGRFAANKGHLKLLNAIPEVIEKHPDTRFIFVGSGSEFRRLEEKANEMNINENLELTGFISLEEKINQFKKSHIFVYPSYYGEGFPTVILEAMASGLVLVTTPVGGLVDALEDGKQGLIIKSMPPKPEEIAEKIIRLIENPELMKGMSENNLKEAKEKYDVKVVTRNIGKIYSELVQGRKNHGGNDEVLKKS